MKKRPFPIKQIHFALIMVLLFSCGGGGHSSSVPQQDPNLMSFWAMDFTTDSMYEINAIRVADGVHCHIFVESGLTVSPTAISNIVNEFDNSIYTGDTAAFGSEPNPGADNDSKIYILLLNIKDGFNAATSQSFIAGYFDSRNEFTTEQNPTSNQKELLYMNINPALQSGFPAGGTEFSATIAHEFQHMIHWNQDQHKKEQNDDTWIDEAMSTVARTYCGLGPDYSNVFVYESEPFNSLTVWGDRVQDYGVVYMWAQYFKDQFSDGIFKTMLQNNDTGIQEVRTALSSIGSSRTFESTFRDWSIANSQGNEVPAGHPEWAFTSIDTHSGIHDGISLPGLFSSTSNQNPSSLMPLDRWSVEYYWFTPATPPNGTVTWSQVDANDTASFVDGGSDTVTLNMTSGNAVSYKNTGFLIVQDASDNAGGGDTTVHTEIEMNTVQKTPSMRLEEANASPVLREFMRRTGRPKPLCVDSWFRQKEKELRSQGAKPDF